MTDEIVTSKGYVAYLNLGEGRRLDCYELPDGEKRVGLAGASVSLGHDKSWLGRVAKTGSKLLKALQDNGWNGLQKSILVNVRGVPTSAKTISVSDYVKLISQDAIVNRNPEAIILLAAFAHVGLEKIIDDVFCGNNTEYVLQKIQHYKEWTYEEYMEVLEYNREEAAALFPRWN